MTQPSSNQPLSSMHPQLVVALKQLSADSNSFTVEQLSESLHLIFQGYGSPAQIAAFLVTLSLTKVDQKPCMIAATAQTLLEYAIPIPIAWDPNTSQKIVDIVGTGGDGHNTFNVSTSAAIVAAGAGCKVAKHGNRSASSNSGSADMLEALGCDLHNFHPEQIGEFLRHHNFCFLFAPRFHPSMGRVGKIRKEVGMRTVFNVVGPLINPVVPKHVIVGVYTPSLGPIIAQALMLNGVEHGLVVCGEEGLDEISPQGRTFVWQIRDQRITETSVQPSDFGLPTYSLTEVQSVSGTENAKYLQRILDGEITQSPILDYILMNTSALLVVAGIAQSYREGVALARESIASQRAKQELACFATFTQP
ncbi:anthranilate phosphoribosyltransferase [Dispira simplex]|nr:anthranilate phosphoribosyltransferase [Dispira simplex]